MPAEMGGAEAFIKTYEETLAMVKEVEQLTINPADYTYEITKTGKRDNSVENDRIHRQKQEGLYYVEYHPAGGDANVEHLFGCSRLCSNTGSSGSSYCARPSICSSSTLLLMRLVKLQN